MYPDLGAVIEGKGVFEGPLRVFYAMRRIIQLGF